MDFLDPTSRQIKMWKPLLAPELFASVMKLDFTSTLKITFNAIFIHSFSSLLDRGSKSLYSSTPTINMTPGKRPYIHVSLLKQFHKILKLLEVIQTASTNHPLAETLKRNCKTALAYTTSNSTLKLDDRLGLQLFLRKLSLQGVALKKLSKV